MLSLNENQDSPPEPKNLSTPTTPLKRQTALLKSLIKLSILNPMLYLILNLSFLAQSISSNTLNSVSFDKITYNTANQHKFFYASRLGKLKVYFKYTRTAAGDGSPVITFANPNYNSVTNTCACTNINPIAADSAHPNYLVTCELSPCNIANVENFKISFKIGGTELAASFTGPTLVVRHTSEEPIFYGLEDPLGYAGKTIKLLGSLNYSLPWDPSHMHVNVIASDGSANPTTVCSIAANQTIESVYDEVALSNDYKFYLISQGNEGLRIWNSLSAFECTLDNTIKIGDYNVQLIHDMYGIVPDSKLIMGYYQTIQDLTTIRGYHLRVLTRVEQVSQKVISHLGGYVTLRGPSIGVGSAITIDYEGNDCVATAASTNTNDVKCLLTNMQKPSTRTFYQGSSGLTKYEKPCTNTEYESLKSSYTDPETSGYTKTQIGTLFDLNRYKSSTCVRYVGGLNVPQTSQVYLGGICSPYQCFLNYSTIPDSVNSLLNALELKDSAKNPDFNELFYSNSTYFSNQPATLLSKRSYYYAFTRYVWFYQKSNFMVAPINIPLLNNKVNSKPYGILKKELQRLRIKCESQIEHSRYAHRFTQGTGSHSIGQQITITQMDVELQHQNPSVTYAKFTINNIVIPRDCEGPLEQSSFQQQMTAMMGYPSSFCKVDYADSSNQPISSQTHATAQYIIVTFNFQLMHMKFDDADYSSFKVLPLTVAGGVTHQHYEQPAGSFPLDHPGGLALNGTITLQDNVTQYKYIVKVKSTYTPNAPPNKLDLSDIEAFFKVLSGGDVTARAAQYGNNYIDIYLSYTNPRRMNEFSAIDKNLQGCSFYKAGSGWLGNSKVSFDTLMHGTDDFQFNVPSYEFFRTLHKKPQIVLSKAGLTQLCENCDLDYIGTADLPNVFKIEIDYNYCYLKLYYSNTNIHKLVVTSNIEVKFVKPGTNTFDTSTSKFEVYNHNAQAQYTLLDLKQFISSFPNEDLWNNLDSDHIKTHYADIGFIENSFPKYNEKIVTFYTIPTQLTTSDNLQLGFVIKNPSNLAQNITSTDHASLFSVVYLLEDITNLGAITDQSALLAPDAATKFLNEPITKFSSPRTYRLTTQVTYLASTCLKYINVQSFTTAHVNPSFLVSVPNSFYVNDPFAFNITSFNSQNPSVVITSLQLILDVPNSPNNMANTNVSPVTLNTIANPPMTDTNFNFVNKLTITGNYTLRVTAVFGATYSYAYDKVFEVYSNAFQFIINISNPQNKVNFYTNENIAMRSQFQLIKKTPAGLTDWTKVFPYDPYLPRDQNTFEGFKVMELKWTLGYVLASYTTPIQQFISFCNNPPKETCTIPPFALQISTNYQINATYTIQQIGFTNTQEVVQSYTFSSSKETFIQGIVAQVNSMYYVQEDVEFDGTHSFDPNLPFHGHFQKLVLFSWDLKLGTTSQLTSTASKFKIPKNTMVAGNNYSLEFRVNVGDKIDSKIFIFKAIDKNSAPDFIPLLDLRPMYKQVNTTYLDMPMLNETVTFLPSVTLKNINYSSLTYNWNFGDLSAPKNNQPNLTLTHDELLKKSKFYAPVKLSLVLNGTTYYTVEKDYIVNQGKNGTVIIASPATGQEYTTEFKIVINYNMADNPYENLYYELYFKDTLKDSTYLVVSTSNINTIVTKLPMGQGYFILNAYDDHGMKIETLSNPITISRGDLTSQATKNYFQLMHDPQQLLFTGKSLINNYGKYAISQIKQIVDKLSNQGFYLNVPENSVESWVDLNMLLYENEENQIVKDAYYDKILGGVQQMINFLKSFSASLDTSGLRKKRMIQSDKKENQILGLVSKISKLVGQKSQIGEDIIDLIDSLGLSKLYDVRGGTGRSKHYKGVEFKSQTILLKDLASTSTSISLSNHYSQNYTIDLTMPNSTILLEAHYKSLFPNDTNQDLSKLPFSEIGILSSVLQKNPYQKLGRLQYIPASPVASLGLYSIIDSKSSPNSDIKTTFEPIKVRNLPDSDLISIDFKVEQKFFKDAQALSKYNALPMFKEHRNYTKANNFLNMTDEEMMKEMNLETRCMYFNKQLATWSFEGCYLDKIEEDPASAKIQVVCKCNHLSTFSVGFIPTEYLYNSGSGINSYISETQFGTNHTLASFTQTQYFSYSLSIWITMLIGTFLFAIAEFFISNHTDREALDDKFSKAVERIRLLGFYPTQENLDEDDGMKKYFFSKGGKKGAKFMEEINERQRLANIRRQKETEKVAILEDKYIIDDKRRRKIKEIIQKRKQEEIRKKQINDRAEISTYVSNAEILEERSKIMLLEGRIELGVSDMEARTKEQQRETMRKMLKLDISMSKLFGKCYFYSHSFFSLFTEYNADMPKFLKLSIYFTKPFFLYGLLVFVDKLSDFQTTPEQFYGFLLCVILIVGNLMTGVFDIIFAMLCRGSAKVYESKEDYEKAFKRKRIKILVLSGVKSLVIIAICFSLVIFTAMTQLNTPDENKNTILRLHVYLLLGDFFIFEFFNTAFQMFTYTSLISKDMPAFVKKILIGSLKSQIIISMTDMMGLMKLLD